MHILMLPAGYPHPYHRTSHIFFQDYAEALAPSLDRISVIAIQPITIPKIIALKKLQFGIVNYNKKGVSVVNFTYPSFPKVKFIRNNLRNYFGKKLIKKYINRFGKPDLVHLHVYTLGNLAIWIKEKYNIPYIVTEHYSSLYNKNIPSKDFQLATKTYTHSSYNMAVSKKFCDVLMKKFDSKFSYIPNMVNVEYFRPRLTYSEIFTFLNIANLTKNKNHISLIQAFYNAFAHNSKYRLIIAGSGPERKKLEKKISELQISTQIHMAGAVNRQEVLHLMQNANAFVLSSIQETFGVVLIEAMSTGLPLLSTKSGGPESIITDKRLGVLVDNNVESLAQGLQDIAITHYDTQFIRNAAKNNFSYVAVSGKLIEIYDNYTNPNKKNILLV